MAENKDGLQRLDLPLTGMSCASCAANIQKGLESMPGVSSYNFV